MHLDPSDSAQACCHVLLRLMRARGILYQSCDMLDSNTPSITLHCVHSTPVRMGPDSLVVNHEPGVEPGVEQLGALEPLQPPWALAGEARFHLPWLRADQRSWAQRYWCGLRLTARSRTSLNRRTSRPCSYSSSTRMHFRNPGAPWIYQR